MESWSSTACDRGRPREARATASPVRKPFLHSIRSCIKCTLLFFYFAAPPPLRPLPESQPQEAGAAALLAQEHPSDARRNVSRPALPPTRPLAERSRHSPAALANPANPGVGDAAERVPLLRLLPKHVHLGVLAALARPVAKNCQPVSRPRPGAPQDSRRTPHSLHRAPPVPSHRLVGRVCQSQCQSQALVQGPSPARPAMSGTHSHSTGSPLMPAKSRNATSSPDVPSRR